MGIGNMISKIFKKEDSSKHVKGADKLDLDTLIKLPDPVTEKVFLYKTINFEDISIRDKD